MVKTAVKVFVRTRPTATSGSGLKIGTDGQSVSVNIPKDQAAGLVNNQQESFSFKFDGVLDNVSQEGAFSSVAHEVVDSLMAGYNGTVFCYGQTGAGKTFTLSGGGAGYAHRGIIPRSIHQVFREVDMRVDKMYRVHVSYLEIYNEQLYDLLGEAPGTSDTLAVLEDANNATYVRGLTLVPVRSEEEALAQFFLGEQGRTTAGHVLNAESSRSHTVFTLHVEMRTSEAASERAVLSKLNLVDLAGSERTKKTGVTGQSLREAQFINRSLSFLEQTVNALSRRDSYIPYRQTKLTAVLRDALGGNCKTVMVANVWAEPSHTEETLSTLRFASRVRTLTTDLAVNESSDPQLLLRRYERQIKELKAELAMRDTLSGKARVSYDDPSDDELRELHALARRFLAGEAEVEELPVDSIKRVREAFKALRAVHAAVRGELASVVNTLRRTEDGRAATAPDDPSQSGAVGELDARAAGGFTVGRAPLDARPPPRSEVSYPVGGGGGSPSGARPPALAAQASTLTDDAGPLSSPSGASIGLSGPAGGRLAAIFAVPGDRNAVFRRYKVDVPEGRDAAASLKAASTALRDCRTAIRSLGAGVNEAKRRIDDLTAAVAMRRGGGAGAAGAGGAGADGEVLDSETYGLVQELKAAKSRYRTDFDALKAAREELEPLLQAAAVARAGLLEAFDRWAGAQSEGLLRRMATAGRAMPGAPDEEDELDAGEAFERMQMARITERDPDSLAYHAALKRTGGAGPGAGAPSRPATVAAPGAKAAAAASRKQEATAAVNRGAGR